MKRRGGPRVSHMRHRMKGMSVQELRDAVPATQGDVRVLDGEPEFVSQYTHIDPRDVKAMYHAREVYRKVHKDSNVIELRGWQVVVYTWWDKLVTRWKSWRSRA